MFKGSDSSKKAKYKCIKECKMMTLGVEKVARRCYQCSSTYESRNRTQLTCSPECSEARRVMRSKKSEGFIPGPKPVPSETSMKIMKCRWCRDEYTPRMSAKPPTAPGVCSDMCRANVRLKILSMVPAKSVMRQHKESMDPPRKINCRHYEACLNLAVLSNWTGFSCKMCPIDDEWTEDELRDQAKAMERFLNQESALKGVWK